MGAYEGEFCKREHARIDNELSEQRSYREADLKDAKADLEKIYTRIDDNEKARNKKDYKTTILLIATLASLIGNIVFLLISKVLL